MTYHRKYSFTLLIITLTMSNVCCTSFSLCKRSSSTDYSALPADGATAQPEPDIISCPRPTDPPEFSACCYDKHFENESVAEGFEPVTFTTFRCCVKEPQASLFSFVSDRAAMIFIISLTALLLITTVVTLICCFWSRCPLYMACRIRYRQDDIIAYDCIDDETKRLNGMPSEEKKGVKIYAPNAVKITMKNDD